MAQCSPRFSRIKNWPKKVGPSLNFPVTKFGKGWPTSSPRFSRIRISRQKVGPPLCCRRQKVGPPLCCRILFPGSPTFNLRSFQALPLISDTTAPSFCCLGILYRDYVSVRNHFWGPQHVFHLKTIPGCSLSCVSADTAFSMLAGFVDRYYNSYIWTLPCYGKTEKEYPKTPQPYYYVPR